MLKVDNELKAFQYIKNFISDEVEEVWVLALNSHLELIKCEMIFRGTVNFCPFHSREIFKSLIINNAVTFILIHNHPSSHCEPSRDDIRITKRITSAGRLLQIPLLDHLIVNKKSYYSFRGKI